MESMLVMPLDVDSGPVSHFSRFELRRDPTLESDLQEKWKISRASGAGMLPS